MREEYVSMGMDEKVKSLKNVIRMEALQKDQPFPEIMELASRAETRDGLWWYDPVSRRFEFSLLARTHYQLSGFDNKIESVKGWVRGYIVSREGMGYILIYMCDFLSEPMSGAMLNDLYNRIKDVYPKEICGIVAEDGYSLVG